MLSTMKDCLSFFFPGRSPFFDIVRLFRVQHSLLNGALIDLPAGDQVEVFFNAKQRERSHASQLLGQLIDMRIQFFRLNQFS